MAMQQLPVELPMGRTPLEGRMRPESVGLTTPTTGQDLRIEAIINN
jgi:hypothetical protein